MPWGVAGAAIGAAGSIGGGILGSKGAEEQAAAMREAIDLDKERYKQSTKNLSPYVQFGQEHLNRLSDFVRDRNPAKFRDPGYEFRREQGLESIEGSAAARGNLLSGDTLRALTEYGQDMASQEYGNAFNRYLSEGNFLQNLAGMGQSAAVGLGHLGNQSSANIANATANAGYGNASRIWGDVVSGIGGMAGDAFNKYGKNWFGKGSASAPGGANVFKLNPADDAMVG